MNTECLLAVLPGSHDEDNRLAVYLLRSAQGDTQLSLRQQSYAQGIGWYDQKTLELAPAQLRQLRTVLGMAGGPVQRAPATEADEPAILAFPGARTESA